METEKSQVWETIAIDSNSYILWGREYDKLVEGIISNLGIPAEVLHGQTQTLPRPTSP